MTNLIRFSPGTELRRMQHEFDRLFNDFFPAANGNGNEEKTAVWSPRVDLSETNDTYFIQVDVPGIAKKDLSINYQDGTLTISGERKGETREEGKNYVRTERNFGHFFRSFNIPNAIQADKIQANYTNGVLSIQVPKAEEVKPINVKVS
jgi:HSP20 family protein